jgi:dipeptidyl aminopeptidase/acylaminoacyl peptidase
VNRPQTKESVPSSPGELWEQRYRAARVTLPDWAWDAPDRGVALSNASGTVEIYAFDAAAARADDAPGAGLRQVTDREQGTLHATITPDGRDIWWFADTDGDEFGVWNVQPWDGSGEPRPVSDALKPGWPAGLAIARDGTAYVGRSDDDGTEIWRIPAVGEAMGEARVIYSHKEDASVGDVTDDGQLISISHSEHGDNRHPALRVVRPDGTVVADLWDGAGKGLDSAGFAPDRPILLVGHERRGRPELLVWDLTSPDGEHPVNELAIDLSGELNASWYVEGDALLLERGERARSELFRAELGGFDPGAGQPFAPVLTAIATAPGVVAGATTRPGGDVWLSWTSGANPPRIRDLDDRVVVRAPGTPPPAGAPFRDVTVQTPAGSLHALLAVPPGPGPHPAVFDIHGGPNAQDEDAFDARSSAFVDAGFAVVLVNYRGSTGYGSAWRDANEDDVGYIELADVAAVRAALVDEGTLDPARTAVTGGSWGGYLALLAAGIQPDLWAAVIAIVPVADYIAEYEDEMEPLRAFDRALLGGSPEEVPEKYHRASPLTYAAAVKAPLLVMAGLNDPRCPIRQVENYLHKLDDLGTPYELYTYEAGHGALVTQERIHQMKLELGHLARHVPSTPRAV